MKTRNGFTVFRIFVAVNILPEQSDFLNPRIDEFIDFFKNHTAFPADFASSDKRNDAVAAEVIAAVHNCDIRRIRAEKTPL